MTRRLHKKSIEEKPITATRNNTDIKKSQQNKNNQKKDLNKINFIDISSDK